MLLIIHVFSDVAGTGFEFIRTLRRKGQNAGGSVYYSIGIMYELVLIG